MSKPNHKAARLESGLNKTATNPAVPEAATGRHTGNELRTQTTRPVGSGTSKRGDRRDTHPSFSTGKGQNRDGGRSGPLGAAGRKSGPKSAGNRPAGTGDAK